MANLPNSMPKLALLELGRSRVSLAVLTLNAAKDKHLRRSPDTRILSIRFGLHDTACLRYDNRYTETGLVLVGDSLLFPLQEPDPASISPGWKTCTCNQLRKELTCELSYNMRTLHMPEMNQSSAKGRILQVALDYIKEVSPA